MTSLAVSLDAAFACPKIRCFASIASRDTISIFQPATANCAILRVIAWNAQLIIPQYASVAILAASWHRILAKHAAILALHAIQILLFSAPHALPISLSPIIPASILLLSAELTAPTAL